MKPDLINLYSKDIFKNNRIDIYLYIGVGIIILFTVFCLIDKYKKKISKNDKKKNLLEFCDYVNSNIM